VLAPGERILLRGGFGSVFGWVWMVMFLGMALFCFGPTLVVQFWANLTDQLWLRTLGSVLFLRPGNCLILSYLQSRACGFWNSLLKPFQH
jgi:hypothetical protein